ncbi:hypothetical protein C8R47DRAFT_1045654 [Mycena vitilis]|nr:hypothetical protein C8R47DRAFT_1045654 [Mycena vitilis]
MHHNPSRMVRERRQTPSVASSASAVVDANPTSHTSASEVNLTVPTSTTALAVVVCILALAILLGVGICVFRRRRNAKKEPAPSHIIDFSNEKPRRFDVESKLDLHASAYLEKPSAVFIPGASAADMNPSWVPQINPNRDADMASNSTSSSKKYKNSKKSLRASRGWDKHFSKFAPSERSPPPSYMADRGENSGAPSAFESQIPLPPSPPHQSTTPPTPPTPPAKKALNPFSREIPAAKPAPLEPIPQMPLPSPLRSASFANQQSATFAEMETVEEEHAAPRLMNVINSFTPTLDDELLIQVGETVRMLEEYQDGWALVQRIGRIDAPKGVVPRTTITDRERVIPTYVPVRRM